MYEFQPQAKIMIHYLKKHSTVEDLENFGERNRIQFITPPPPPPPKKKEEEKTTTPGPNAPQKTTGPNLNPIHPQSHPSTEEREQCRERERERTKKKVPTQTVTVKTKRMRSNAIIKFIQMSKADPVSPRFRFDVNWVKPFDWVPVSC